eukprot:1140818-Pelagomonas_calceolata.AAC.1
MAPMARRYTEMPRRLVDHPVPTCPMTEQSSEAKELECGWFLHSHSHQLPSPAAPKPQHISGCWVS